MSDTPIHRHRGIYALIIERGHVLTIRKSRGPYRGQLDLVGGAPLVNEGVKDTLLREVREEVGGLLLDCGPLHELYISFEYSVDGAPIQFEHTVRWCEATVEGVDPQIPPTEDVAGVEWIALADVDGRADISRPLREVLAQHRLRF